MDKGFTQMKFSTGDGLARPPATQLRIRAWGSPKFAFLMWRVVGAAGREEARTI